MRDPQPVGSITPEQFRRLRALFEAAFDHPAADRRRWLEAACGGDVVLLRHVERLLAADSQRHHLLDSDHKAPHEPEGPAFGGAGALPVQSDRSGASGLTPAAPGDVPRRDGGLRSGALFAERFLIVALQGRGGMGQVYRAHDLELGQLVALKFLTELRSDQRARTRLRTEVRLARQISHPNVCRVYDIGEADGELYLSMEYVDGEDLAALLKRVGRLPERKGVEIARKLCAGLAAAHARGVLHRDLKPANIMLDTHGEVRIMDFGLAAVAGQLDAADAHSGTAAYMAPEQLEGREATARCDIYALGLVLYELFTGRPAFHGQNAAEFLRLRGAPPSTPPSALVRDLDPAIERAVLQCLAPDARMRPASALDVARSLPGGDPLADALAAGETPSPDLVASAGPDIAMRPSVAVMWLVMICAALTGVLLLTEQTQMVSMVPMEHSPEVLASKARDFLGSVGYPAPAAHVAYGFRLEHGYREYVAEHLPVADATLEGWKAWLGARPAPVSFWYAQSDTPLVPPVANSGAARPIDSLPTVRDAVSVDLDLDGRLLRFVASPSEQEPPATARRSVDWDRFFTAAGLNAAAFTEVPAGRSAGADARRAWTGAYPGRRHLPVRIEAAATAAALTSFEVVFPWTNRDPMLPERTNYATAVLLITIWIAPCVVARFNWRVGRADVRGALRIGTFAFAAHLGSLLLNADRVLDTFVTRPVFWLALALGAWAAIVYIALEPWVRRWWPHAMVGWARVLAGRWRDPIVARDVLVALTLATAYRCAYLAAVVGTIHDGAPPLSTAPIDAVPGEFVLSHLSGPQFTAAHLFSSVTSGFAAAAITFFLLALFRSLLGRQWLGVAALCVVSYLWTSNQPHFRGEWLPVLAYLLFLAVFVFAALRYGFLAIVIASCASQIMYQSILTRDLGAWYGRSSLVATLLVIALAIWAARVLVRQQPLFPRQRENCQVSVVSPSGDAPLRAEPLHRRRRTATSSPGARPRAARSPPASSARRSGPGRWRMGSLFTPLGLTTPFRRRALLPVNRPVSGR